MSLISTLFPTQRAHAAPLRGKQTIAVFHGTNRTAGATGSRRGVNALGALNHGGGISPGRSGGSGGHGGGKGK